MRGAEHIAAHCPGNGARHEIVVLTCGQCLDDVIDDSITTKDKLIKMGWELKDAIIKDRLEPSQVSGMFDIEVFCGSCRATLDAQVSKLSSSPRAGKITVIVVPHLCSQPPSLKRSIVFTKGSNPRGDM